MTAYTFSEARQRFAFILEWACREGTVRVRRRDGQVFLIQPEHQTHSPLDVLGLDASISAEEIVATVRAMRRRVKSPSLFIKGPQRTRRKRSAAS